MKKDNQRNHLFLALPVLGLVCFILVSQYPQSPSEKSKTSVQEKKVKVFKKRLEQWIKTDNHTSDMTLQSQSSEITLKLKGGFVFQSDSANMTPQSQALLKELAKRLVQTPFSISIEAQVDHLPPKKKKVFPTVWEYATARSSRVARFLNKELGAANPLFATAHQLNELKKNVNQIKIRLSLKKPRKKESP